MAEREENAQSCNSFTLEIYINRITAPSARNDQDLNVRQVVKHMGHIDKERGKSSLLEKVTKIG